MIELSDVILRLGAATIAGGAIGLNRNIHHKPTGLRTLSIVSLGSAMAVLMATEAGTGPNPVSPVIQGVLTGIGFLGAGVIVHELQGNNNVRGLTTAATIWLTACLGCVFGLGQWPVAGVACALMAVVLFFGGRLEKIIHRRIDRDDEEPKSARTSEGQGATPLDPAVK